MFPLLEAVLKLTFRDDLEYTRRIIFNRRFVIESNWVVFWVLETAKCHRGLCRDCTEVVEAMRYCVYLETAAEDTMNALARHRGKEASHCTHASHS